MKSSRFIQNTDLATLKNRGKYTAEITIPSSFTTQNGNPMTIIASAEIYVGEGNFEPFFIYEDQNGFVSTGGYEDENSAYWVNATRRAYSSIDNQWHETDDFIYIDTAYAGAGVYRLEAYVTELWNYTLYDATWTVPNPKTIKLYLHTFIDPFNQ